MLLILQRIKYVHFATDLDIRSRTCLHYNRKGVYFNKANNLQ